jgi:Pyridoxamine 5'-phosphate oxidase
VVVTWPDRVDDILGGDLTAALGYITPARGVVVMAVAPIGLRDRERGTVSFTTSLGFAKKLERLAQEPRVALAFHAREHGYSARPEYVLVQGRAEPIEQPDPAARERVRVNAERYLGKGRSGPFWDRWLREYYMVRIPVNVHVERIVVWPDLRCAGEPEVFGAPRPEAPPAPQSPPKRGTGPRVDMDRTAKRLRRTKHRLLGYVGADGFPAVVPVELGSSGEPGLELRAAPGLIPEGGRRAGLCGHSYRPKLIGLTTRQHTGWLDASDGRAVYAPHTATGFVAPPNKTLLLFFNGLQAKQGVRKSRRAAGS